MAITVKHKFVSTIPDGDDTSVVRPSNWNDTHDLVGTVPVANGGTGAATLTGYVKGNGTSNMTASSTIPNTDITGLGTASTKDAGVANGVATLDGSGTVPISQLPAAVVGALSYQGTWNASTNTPTLTSSVGTKGYYYVVNVAGSTNLNGITDWQVGDWAVYNGSAWQKIDNTDQVSSVNGKTGTVVLTYSDVGAFPATSTTGSGNVVLATGATQAHPTISDYETFTSTSAPSYAEGEIWYDSTQKALAYYNDVTNNTVHIGQEVQLKVINNTGSSIANGTPVYVTGTSSGQSYPNIALAKADAVSTSAVLGLTNGTIASGAVGYVCTAGLLTPCNTGSFTVGQVLYLSPYSAGQLMNTVPPTGYAVQVGVVAYANSPNGSIYIKQTTPLAVSASTITGTVAVNQGGTGVQTITGYVKGSGTSAFTGSSTIPTTDLSGTITNAQLANSAITINGTSTSLGGSASVGTVTSVAATAGTGISVSGSPITSSGTLTITNTAPDQTVAITSGTGISVTGTYPNFTVTNTSPSSGGTVTSVTGTAPISSSGGNTPAISISQAGTSTNGYLSSTDWNTFNNKQPAGSYLTSVTADAPLTGSGTSGSHLSIPAATTSANGYLTSADWTTFNGKQATLVSGTNIKTVSGVSLLGSGDVGVIGATYGGTGFSTYATGDIIYSSATNTLSKLSAGTNGQVLTLASGVPSWATPASLTWQSVQTANFTAVSGNAYPINTTSSAITVTLPASPTAGNLITLTDYAGKFATNNLTINPNGNKLDGATLNGTLSTNRESVQLVYIDSTQGWIAYAGFNDSTIPQGYSASYLLVAGGGSGNSGGGGGGGGLLSGTIALTGGTTYTVTVGAGGSTNNNGSNSTITGSGLSTITSIGGGSGQASGGSGGGGASSGPGNGTSGQGNNGGTAQWSNNFAGGGGGGAGAAGGNAPSNSSPGTGGNGASSSITGSAVTYAGGGGGGLGLLTGSFAGGSGGGGAGAGQAQTAGNGTANLGGGGGGSGGIVGTGGSGVGILSVPSANYTGTVTGSPTVTTSGSNTIIKFTSTGTYTA